MRHSHFWAKTFGCIFLLALSHHVFAYSYITVIDARQMAERGEALIIDVRQQQYYEEGHISGALLLPLDGLEVLVRSSRAPIKTSDMLILYCDCPAEETSIMAASILEHYGYTKVYVLKGGWQAWKDASFPIAEGKEPGSLPKRKEECKVCETQAPQTLSPALPQTREPEKSSVPILFLFFLLACIGIVGMMLVYAYFKKR